MCSLAPKIDELDAVVSINHADIICITEAWLSSVILDNVTALPNLNLFRNDRLGSIRFIMVVSKTQEVAPLSPGYFAGCCISLNSIASI